MQNLAQANDPSDKADSNKRETQINQMHCDIAKLLETVQEATAGIRIIFGNRWRHLLGERDLWEHVGGVDISLDPSSFGQANTRAFDSLLWKLHKYVPAGSSVADLYAGAGVIGLSLATSRKCRECPLDLKEVVDAGFLFSLIT